jgi:hypothetical protein
MVTLFQSTQPVKGATYFYGVIELSGSVSITAPVKGATPVRGLAWLVPYWFHSTHP